MFLFTLVLINYVDRVALSVAAKPIALEFGLSPVAMGYLFSSFLWTYLVCLVPIGMVVDRLGTKGVIGGGIVTWSLATIATGIVTSFSALLGTRLVMGAAEATSYPASVRVIRDWFPERERGLVTAAFNGGSSSGPAVGALLTGLLVSLFDWRTAFLYLGALGLVWFAAWQALFASPERAGWLHPAERALILSERNGGIRSEAVTAPASSIKHLLSQRTVWGLVLAQACIVYTNYLFLTWLPTYLQSARTLTQLSVGVFTAIPYLLTTLFSILIAMLSDRVLSSARLRAGGRRMFVAAMALMSTAILLAQSASTQLSLTMVLTVVLTGSNTASAMNFALANDLMRNPRDVSRVAGLMLFGGNTFGLAAPIITGYIVASTGGYDWAFRIAAILAVCAGAFSFVMARMPVVGECNAVTELG